MTESTHDINGPSRLWLREACPGSARMEVQMPPDAGSDAATAGTNAHAVMARCLSVWRMPTLGDAGADMALYSALGHCWEDAARSHLRDVAGVVSVVEFKVALDPYGIPKGGTLDYAWVVPGDRFHLFDWKFGEWIPPRPRDNRQFQALALGLADDFGCTSGRLSLSCGSVAGTWSDDATADDLARWRTEVRDIVNRAGNPNAPLAPGPHCSKCRARNNCPALEALTRSVTAANPISAVSALASLPPEDRATSYQRMKLAAAWLKGAIETVDQAIVDGGLQVPGYRPGKGRGTRMWSNEAQAIRVLESHLGEGAWDSTLLSPAAAEKALKAAGVNASRVLVDSHGVPLIATTIGKPRVVADGGGNLLGEES